MLNKRVGIVVVILLVGAFTVAMTQGPGGPPTGENILVIVMDDIGVESVGAYAEGRCLGTDDICSADGDCGPSGDCRPEWVPMERLELLADEGTVFRSAWAQPSCSPTRATILTGRYGYRQGVNRIKDVLSTGERTLPELLGNLPTPYATAAFGKWHLTGSFEEVCPDGAAACLDTYYSHPTDTGFDHFEGAMGNLNNNHRDWLNTCVENAEPCVVSHPGCTCTDPEDPGENVNYFKWTLTENGAPRVHDGFAPPEHVDNARAWIQQQTTPWFVYFNFNLSHSPYQVPLLDGVSQATRDALSDPTPGAVCGLPNSNRRKCYNAMLEAMDYQLGRLLDPDGTWPGIPANTTIILVGDNGTPSKVTTGPFRPKQMKGTLYEGGVNVPLIVRPASGWTLDAESDALVHTVDLFGLVLDLAGTTPPQHGTIDSRPIPGFDTASYSEREWVLAERGCNARAVRDERYKLILRDFEVESACPDNAAGNQDNDCDQFFDLETDPFETDNLLPLPIGSSSELQQIYADLRAVLDAATAEVVEGTPCYEE